MGANSLPAAVLHLIHETDRKYTLLALIYKCNSVIGVLLLTVLKPLLWQEVLFCANAAQRLERSPLNQSHDIIGHHSSIIISTR